MMLLGKPEGLKTSLFIPTNSPTEVHETNWMHKLTNIIWEKEIKSLLSIIAAISIILFYSPEPTTSK